ncbi:hypothetical protein GLP24_17695 [Photobacterium carnosum]|uniref:hypothetical protein n=1 Tax=Photobacterium carnosum TaxID=2023717 RepID=UPI001E4B48D5|nr:hypothetical protein [Photobacterium carnosum]MCD9546675.1 hypothetical protein [Photobacterium carnosum]
MNRLTYLGLTRLLVSRVSPPSANNISLSTSAAVITTTNTATIYYNSNLAQQQRPVL